MHPLRILILIVLFYILFRLLIGSRKNKQNSATGKKSAPAVAQDILVEDPVCHTCIPKKQAVLLDMADETYYFCSDTCRDKFSENNKGDNR